MLKAFPILILILAIATGCKKKDISSPSLPPTIPPVIVPPPTISSFAITDYCNRKVTIYGTNFNPDKSKDSVFIGTVKVVIDSATTTQLFVKYPAGLQAEYIFVYSNGLWVRSANQLIITTPTITSCSPTLAGPGVLVTITGQNFNSNADSVLFGNKKGEVILATATQIIVRVPWDATSGSISVYSSCQLATSSTVFTFSNKGTVYATGNLGFVYAIDIASGSFIWNTNTNSHGLSSPTYANGVIYAGSTDVSTLSNNYMYALNAKTGEEIWKYNSDLITHYQR
jgi:outer membrane protein assembly factor BamB